MNGALLVLIVLVVVAIGLAVYASSKASGKRNAASLDDAKADARRVIERLGGQVLNLTGSDDASKQAHGRRVRAVHRRVAPRSTRPPPPSRRCWPRKARIEGLYYVRAARIAMGMDPGPELESLAGQRSAGTVTEDRRVDFEGREIEASPDAVGAHPELLPRRPGRRPPGPRRLVLRAVVEAGAGGRAWGLGSVLLFDAMFSGCTVVGYEHRVSSRATATATRTARRPGRTVAAATDAGDGGGDGGGWDSGGGDWGGGGDFGGDFGGF